MIIIKAQMTPGTTVFEAFDEAIKVAKKLECYIEFNFNGVICLAYPNGTAKRGEESYMQNIKLKTNVAFS